jgi:hypothetical protein
MKTRLVLALVGMVGLLLNVEPATAGGGENENACKHGCKGPYPDGYNGFLVFMATGSLPLTDSYFLDGDYFQSNIMKRSPAQVAQNRADALAFFSSRFGIDAENDPRIAFFDFYVDPRIDYRAYVISGYKVPTSGFEVHDGGWLAAVVDPAGITLGGDFPGRHVPVNTFFSFGDYSVERTAKGGPQPAPLNIAYRCMHPLVFTFSGGEVFDCELDSQEFGAGLGQGVTTPLIEDGQLKPNGRTVLTFSDAGGY